MTNSATAEVAIDAPAARRWCHEISRPDTTDSSASPTLTTMHDRDPPDQLGRCGRRSGDQGEDEQAADRLEARDDRGGDEHQQDGMGETGTQTQQRGGLPVERQDDEGPVVRRSS